MVTQLYDELLKPLDLYSTQFTLLVAISAAGSAPMTPIARELAMDRTTLARNLEPLVRQGFVEVSPGKDQRVRMVKLTEAGREKLAQAIPLWEAGQKIVIEHLGRERWTALMGDLAQLTKLAKDNDPR